MSHFGLGGAEFIRPFYYNTAELQIKRDTYLIMYSIFTYEI